MFFFYRSLLYKHCLAYFLPTRTLRDCRRSEPRFGTPGVLVSFGHPFPRPTTYFFQGSAERCTCFHFFCINFYYWLLPRPCISGSVDSNHFGLWRGFFWLYSENKPLGNNITFIIKISISSPWRKDVFYWIPSALILIENWARPLALRFRISWAKVISNWKFNFCFR